MVWKASSRLRAVAGWARVGWYFCRRWLRFRLPLARESEGPPIQVLVRARRSAQWQSIDGQLAALRETGVDRDVAA